MDPTFLTRKKDWGRNSLAQNTRAQLKYDKDVEAINRETRKMVSQLQNSKSYHTGMLRKLQDRQMEICKSRIQEQILHQAQARYDKVHVLETKRFCGACSRRPKSAIASSQISEDSIARLPSTSHSKNHRTAFDSPADSRQPIKFVAKRKVKSAVLPPRNCDRFVPEVFESRLVPSPEVTDEKDSHRPISPLRSFDFSPIPSKYRPFRKYRRRLVRSARL